MEFFNERERQIRVAKAVARAPRAAAEATGLKRWSPSWNMLMLHGSFPVSVGVAADEIRTEGALIWDTDRSRNHVHKVPRAGRVVEEACPNQTKKVFNGQAKRSR